MKLNDIAAFGNMTIIDDLIYYIVVTSSGTKNIYRMRIDGSNATKLTDDNVERFNISGGYIYYSELHRH